MREYAEAVLGCLAERIEEEAVLRAVVKIFDAESFKGLLDSGTTACDAVATFGVAEIEVLGAHFDKPRGDERFLDAEALKLEFLKFKASHPNRWKNLSFKQVVTSVIRLGKAAYPNLWALANVIKVMCVCNAACEGGFRNMVYLKTKYQGRMKTTTLDHKQFVFEHGPDLKNDGACNKLVLDVAKSFWIEEMRVASRAKGQAAAAKKRVLGNKKKRKRKAKEQKAETEAQNKKIRASGPAKMTVSTFEHPKYVALPKPEIDASLQNQRLAKLMDDGTWELGRIKAVRKKATHSITGDYKRYKYTFKWKSSNSKHEFTKMKLFDKQYGRHWVLFDKKPTA